MTKSCRILGRGLAGLFSCWVLAHALSGTAGNAQGHWAEGVAYWKGSALGAPADIRIAHGSEAPALELLNKSVLELRRLEALFSLYQSDSEISRLNSQGYLAAPSPELLTLMSIVDRIHGLTGGSFDPTIQPLWSLYAESAGKPEAHILADVLASVGWDSVRFDTNEVRLEKAGAALSLNGIAQGFITDRISEYLLDQGIESALIKVGEIRVIGASPGGEPWEIGVADVEDMAADQVLRLVDAAVATSAVSATTFAGTAGHILNPRTGLPAAPRWRRVSVVHPSAAIADAISTAAVLLDVQALERVARSVSGVAVFAVYPDGARWTYSDATSPTTALEQDG